MNSSKELSRIRGIGTAKQRWLQAIGITTIQALATTPTEAIAQQLAEKGYSASAEEIAAWVAKAQALLSAVSVPPEVVEPEVAQQKADSKSDGWAAIASFNVEFQSRKVAETVEQRVIIRHHETNTTETLSEQNIHYLQQGLLERVQMSLIASNPAAQVPQPLTVTITQVELVRSRSAATMTATPEHRLFAEQIVANEPFELVATVEFSDLPAEGLNRPLICQLTAQARHLSGGSTIELGSVVKSLTLHDAMSYRFMLPEANLPQAGAYRLHLSFTVQNAPATVASFKIPLLSVYQASELSYSANGACAIAL
ncbi:MAG TPA: hypothetical protein IGS53_22700 [Leptolyngbyaceae cyanobacterium M33_DOE_097]|uniref:DUF4332 domain-containing protein n=1 Tax=Oscillatoriales cyanobacterium SpSt-418 TaxID=2282169 RepID=A0A7C3PGW8_9CYAN|nr:hypothetical protein [Leptolyngbyaceae cyanobacterium M33_DOE_097]